MVERRALTDGLKATPSSLDVGVERSFVYNNRPSSEVRAASTVSRVPMSTRIRADLAGALKRASLERQLNGQEPSAMSDMLEQAIEPWLRANGYLS